MTYINKNELQKCKHNTIESHKSVFGFYKAAFEGLAVWFCQAFAKMCFLRGLRS